MKTYFRSVEFSPFRSQLKAWQKRTPWKGALSTLICVLMGAGFAQAGSVLGNLRGVTRDVRGTPLPGVQVSARNIEDKTDRKIVSDLQGAFVIGNVKPGRYQLKASKGELATSSTTTVTLSPLQDLRVDMVLTTPSQSKRAATSNPTAHPHLSGAAEPTGAAPLSEREKLLLERLNQLEQRVAALEAEKAMESSQSPARALAVPASPGETPAEVAFQRLPAPAASPDTSNTSSGASAQQPAHNLAGAATPSQARPAAPILVASLTGTAGTGSAEKSPTDSIQPTLAAAASPAALPAPAGGAVSGPMTKAAAAATQEAASPANRKIDPFSDWDWTWLNGNPRTKNIYWDTKFFTPEIRADLNYNWQNHHPADHSLGGSSEIFREGEVQMEQFGVGGDFHWDNVRARFMTQYGMYSETTPRNDASPANGEWNLDTAYRYLSEAYGGYHFNVMNGLNVDAGIFLSYIGLFSYYNFDNWAYQPSYVSSNTPWFFNGVRIQFFPTAHLKIEPWIINGWQSYGSANNRPGLGGQIKWTPYSWMNIIFNNYGLGNDDLYAPGRARIHTDDSIEIKYYDKPANKWLDKMAFSFTGDLGCEYGAGVSCTGDHKGGPKQSFIGGMLYNRWWFHRDQFGLTFGGGEINNPGRYLVLLPPINGETAPSAAINSPYFTENPGDKFKAWDSSLTFDWMPKEYITFRVEGDYRHANVPYWTGRGGITPPPYSGVGGDVINGNGYPTEYACNNGAPSGATVLSAAQTACANLSSTVWFPNLVKDEFIIDFDILVKF
jgi:hypothetical protein